MIVQLQVVSWFALGCNEAELIPVLSLVFGLARVHVSVQILIQRSADANIENYIHSHLGFKVDMSPPLLHIIV